LDFISTKSKKTLVFAKLVSELSVESGNNFPDESLINGDIFLIASSDPWYGDILVYLQNLKFLYFASCDERQIICHQAHNYLIIDDTLYRRGFDYILCHFLTHEEVEIVLNEYHTRACGDHLYGLEIAQTILHVGYFWPSLIKDCVEAVKKCHSC
jgi:hypothetical protein